MTTIEMSKRAALVPPATPAAIDDVEFPETSFSPIAQIAERLDAPAATALAASLTTQSHTSAPTTIEVGADEDEDATGAASVWDWAHLRYADDELDEFDAMLDGKPRW